MDRPLPRRNKAALAVAGALLAILIVLAVNGSESDAASQDQISLDPSLDQPIGDLEIQARQRWPETFGGLWIDNEANVVKVAFTESAAENVKQLTEGFPDSALVEPVSVVRSLKELEGAQREMILDRDDPEATSAEFRGSLPESYDLDINVPANRLVVDLLDENDLDSSAAFREAYGKDVEINVIPMTSPSVCERDDCGPDLRSGLKTNISGGGFCSTAFTVVRPNGERNLLSAAHCGGGDVGNGRRHGGSDYGNVGDQIRFKYADAERHTKNNNFGFKPWTFVNSNYKAEPVTGESTYNGLAIGSRVCKSGYTTGKSCGEVYSKTYSPNWVNEGSSFIKAGYCEEDGDSGAGVYKEVDWGNATGIHSGGANLNCGDPDDFGVFGHIERATTALDVEVVHDN